MLLNRHFLCALAALALLLTPAVGADEPALPRSPLLCPVADAPAVRELAGVKSVPRDAIRINYPFELSGQILVSNRRTGQLLCKVEDTLGVLIWGSYATGDECRSGDLFAASGYIMVESEDREPTLFATNMVRLGTAPLPATPLVTGLQINGTRDRHRSVSVRGVLASATCDELDNQWNWLTLKTQTGTIYASTAACDHPIKSLQRLVDAEVTLRGLTMRAGGWIKFANGILGLYNNAITVDREPPTDPFDLPEQMAFDQLHRQRLSGVQLAATREHLYLRANNGRFIAVAPVAGTDARLNGHRLSAVGFVESWHNGQAMLVEALTRDEGPATATSHAPQPLDPTRFFIGYSGHRYANPEYFGKTVTIDGRVTESPDDVRTGGVFLLDCLGHTVHVDASALFSGAHGLPATGSRLRVTGICLMSFEHNPNTALFFPRFRGFTIVPRSATDLEVLAGPPWWTPRRLLSVILALLGALVVFAVWNRTLRIAAERRGRALAKERLAHTRSEVKVEERTRLAVELHDSLSQTLTGIALQLDSAERANAGASAAVTQFLALARQTLDSCRKELQCCLWDLRSRTFEEKDMTEAIQRAIAPHLGGATALVRFNVPRARLSETSAHAILRIVRELVVNAIRHGRATQLRIAGEFHDATISFSVRDNGAGFDPARAAGPATGHFGLQGIRERLRNFRGALAVESRPGKGARFEIQMKTDSCE